jgi:Cysteine-rich secretory protein family
MTSTWSTTMRAISHLAVALLLAIGGLGGASTPVGAQGDCTVAADKLALDAEEAELLRLINAHRAANDVEPPLLQSETLRKVATYLSVDSARRRVSRFPDALHTALFVACGYTGFERISSFAERLCCDGGSAITPDAVFDVWKDSPVPNSNLLDPRLRYVGVSRECAADDQCYWALTLGSEPSGVTETAPSERPGGAGPSAPAQVPAAPSPH